MNIAPCVQCGSPLTAGARFCSSCGTAVASAAVPLPRDAQGILMRGLVLEERYKLLKVLGQGGFSRVYGAVDLRLRTPCAIKENSEHDRAAYEQFIAEAQLLARLKHANLTKVTDYFADPSGGQFLVMEYVPGQDLEQLMRDATALLPWRQVAEWALIVCDVLTYLHTQDPPIIHRDIKPANLRLTPAGTLMVIDLGIAKVQQVGQATKRAAQAYSGGYSPIEQYLGQGTDARSDLYALGATLYHLLSGQMPPEAVNIMRGTAVPALEQLRPDVPPLLARAIMRCMAAEPQDRPPSAQALAIVIEKVLTEHEPAVHVSAQTLVGAEQRSVSQPAIGVQSRTTTQPRSQARPPIGSQPTPIAERATNQQLRVEPRPENVIWPNDQREMVRIPGGPFRMGAEGFDTDEQPVHSVNVPTFLIDRFPVTCAEYARFLAATGHPAPPYWGDSAPPEAIEDHPVVEVTLEDARAYARWAGKRLPTEPEWEKAACWDAAQQHARLYPWGDTWDSQRTNAREGGAGGTVPIGAYTPAGDSPYGVGEMVGNVWEWTASAYKRYPYEANDGREDSKAGGLRATRGGSWSCSPDFVRAANRNVSAASDADFELGFRCAADDPAA